MIDVRKASIAVVVLATAILLLVPSVAFANFAIHGSYSMDTDACAGCHRAHTAASSITWESGANGTRSALLNSDATENYEFCYTCHDAVSLGAVTNVETGIYEGTDNGELGAMLNGGGFDGTAFPTQHTYNGASWGAYGGGTDGAWDPAINQMTGEGTKIKMTCSSCHDVHGSSNYRLLKDVVVGGVWNGVDGPSAVTVGGYPGGNPDPWVISREPGYPTGGWQLHAAGATQMANYVPNYTTPMYARAPGGDADKGMSAWCAACHTQYTVHDASGNFSSMYDANDNWGPLVRHRHPVNVPLSRFDGARDLNAAVSSVLPVAYDAAVDGNGAVTYDPADPFNTTTKTTAAGEEWIDCMTCHVAHGSNATMSGYANVADSTDPVPDSGNGSVPPTDGNALLRMNDRGVCENCHNK